MFVSIVCVCVSYVLANHQTDTLTFGGEINTHRTQCARCLCVTNFRLTNTKKTHTKISDSVCNGRNSLLLNTVEQLSPLNTVE